MTRLCVSIFVDSIEQAKRDIATAVEAGAEIVELRCDLAPDNGDVPFLLAGDFHTTQFIVTKRAASEGGFCEVPEMERLRYLHNASAGQIGFIDIELTSREFIERFAGPNQLIVSSHHFDGRPPKMYSLIEQLNQSRADVVKVAWSARSVRDNLEAFELLQTRQKPTIALCMGEAGFISRVLAKKFGAFLTYAALRKQEVTAPGQPTIHELKNLYRWDALNEKTKVYSVVGSPIAHSMSPAVHNAAFDHIGFDGVYLPLLVEPEYETFKAFMESFLNFPGLDLSGLSITIPHKENALRYLQWKGAQIDEVATRAGAVNTIDIRDGSLHGINTDYDAILDSITHAMNISRDNLHNYRVAVIGAGGTGRTAVAALAEFGATVVIYNRTRERADALAAQFNGKNGRVVSARLEKLCDSCCHIFINTTPVGMHPNIDASPLGERLPSFTADTVVFDTIYNPPTTRLLQQAQAAGAKTISGMELFIRQAAKQFELWTGESAPIDVMRGVLEE